MNSRKTFQKESRAGLFRKESMKLLNYEMEVKPLLLSNTWLNLSNCRLIQLDF